MACQCCNPTTDREAARETQGVAVEGTDCGCGRGRACQCGTPISAGTERHLEEIRRRVSTLEPTQG